MATKKMEPNKAESAKNVCEVPQTTPETLTPKPENKPKLGKDFTAKDLALTATLISFVLSFLAKFFTLITGGSIVMYTVLFSLGFCLVAFSMIVCFIDFKKQGKIYFNVELVLNLLALFVWFTPVFTSSV